MMLELCEARDLLNFESTPLTSKFLEELHKESPILAASVFETANSYPLLFATIAERMLSYAQLMLGSNTLQTLINGYIEFVMEVNTSQFLYEGRQRYEFASYKEVFDAVYNNHHFMIDYHWGVFVTTFAWKHHLKIVEFFQTQFLPYLKKDATLNLIDLGAGSGIWTLLFTHEFFNTNATLVDISPTSVALTQKLINKLNFDNRIRVVEGDALTYSTNTPNNVGISAFLLEHLEEPKQLLRNLIDSLVDGGYAFVTAALTAAEKDHIYEFLNESEVILLAEEVGFRVIACLSAAPDKVKRGTRYLPRSMAMVLQKKTNLIW